MELLFQNGTGKVYQSVKNWLSSSVEELQVSGVLAIVNFARAGKIFVFHFLRQFSKNTKVIPEVILNVS